MKIRHRSVCFLVAVCVSVCSVWRFYMTTSAHQNNQFQWISVTSFVPFSLFPLVSTSTLLWNLPFIPFARIRFQFSTVVVAVSAMHSAHCKIAKLQISSSEQTNKVGKYYEKENCLEEHIHKTRRKRHARRQLHRKKLHCVWKRNR